MSAQKQPQPQWPAKTNDGAKSGGNKDNNPPRPGKTPPPAPKPAPPPAKKGK